LIDNAFPDDRSYTEDHEWVLIAPGAALPDTPVKVGITSVAAAALGDLVFIDLPQAGSSVVTGEVCGEVESTKTVSELIPPVSGTVTAVNAAAVDDPRVITADPYGAGWLFEVAASAAGTLLTAAEYAEMNGVSA
jgi:glycine cleavage system H protein